MHRSRLLAIGALLGFFQPSPSLLPAAKASPPPAQANRLTYLDAAELFHPHVAFPKLATPQWVGEEGVEAVVVLAIDDMRDPARYEAFLRPILERLKQIDGRAALSIMVNAVQPEDPQLASWLKEGMSLEVHTLAHPCPCLQKGDFNAAWDTFHGCVDLMNRIPGNRPVAFRMPCCDSINSPSPRFYREIFNQTNAAGQFLTIDSSVMNRTTTNDASLPRPLVLDAKGLPRFDKYLPTETNALTRISMKSFVTTIQDYPYPYVLAGLVWEFPCALPSDWEAQNIHGTNNPVTVDDWKALLDATVLKQGVFNLVFHPHGWIRNDQIVALIDHAVTRHGRKVKFLNFAEAQARLDRHLLLGHPLRSAAGQDHGVRLLDVNHDGYQDVVVSSPATNFSRVWQPQERRWRDTAFPLSVANATQATGIRFAVMETNGMAAAFLRSDQSLQAVRFNGQRWEAMPQWNRGLEWNGQSVLTQKNGQDTGVRFRDLDQDGRCELILSNPGHQAVFEWSEAKESWMPLPYALPADVTVVDATGRDAGLRFVDVDLDGFDDAFLSNAERFSLHLWVPTANQRLMWKVGWNDEVFSGVRGQTTLDIPAFVRAGPHPDNGAWFVRETLWLQNEDTAHLPDRVDRRTFKGILTADDPPLLTPEQSLAALRVRPGFIVEQAAAEPLVDAPIAFDWDAAGRMWVVEMRDYPLGLDGQGTPGGVVRILEDANGDGRFDRSQIFAEGLSYPNGIYPWRDGVLVSAAPDILFLKDSDGDGKADVRKPLFTGFNKGNPQHLVNGFEYGLDNWLYGANGDSGGNVKSMLLSDREPVNIRGRDFRIQPETGLVEAIAGQTQFGRHRDDWGHWFGNNNPTWLWHYHLPEHYLARNPHLMVRDNKIMLARYTDSGRVFPASRTRQRFNDHHHFKHVTSANSPTAYRDDLFGSEFASSIFISDPVHNLVHREVLEPDGVSFTSHRAADEASSEFLASSDNNFRPTMIKTGPDGALYVSDFYRRVLEHPEWIPDFMERRLDLRAGDGQGRIYRVYPQGASLRPPRRLDNLDAAGLVAALDSPNGWQRDTAQRLLVEQGPKADVVDRLEGFFRATKNPKARLHVLGALDGMHRLSAPFLIEALHDTHPGVRVHALRLSDAFAALDSVKHVIRAGDTLALVAKKYGVSMASLRSANKLKSDAVRVGQVLGVPAGTVLAPELVRMAGDDHIEVRYQLAFSLGEWTWPEAGKALVQLAARDPENSHMQTAVMSSAPKHLEAMLDALLAEDRREGAFESILEQLLSLAVDSKAHDVVARALNRVTRPKGEAPGYAVWQFEAADSFLTALSRRNESLDQFRQEGGKALSKPLSQFQDLIVAARSAAVQDSQPESLRVAAIGVLGRSGGGLTQELPLLEGLMGPRQSLDIQKAALNALNRSGEDAAGEALLRSWHSDSPSMRLEVLHVLLSRSNWIKLLLDRLERREITPGELNTAHQQKLLRHSNRAIQQRAQTVLASARADRQAVLEDYAGVSRLAANGARGAELFRQHCALCHRFRNEGTEIGPDLGALANKSVPVFLTAILDPNQAVEWRYVTYAAETADGREISGVLVAETPNSITLRTAGGKDETLLRSSLKNLGSSRLSLMPEGLEAALNPQAMADLIGYILGH